MHNPKFKNHTTRDLIQNLNRLTTAVAELTEFTVNDEMGREEIKPILTRLGPILVQHSHELNYRFNELYNDHTTEVE